MTTTVAVLAGLYDKLSKDSTFLNNLVGLGNVKQGRDRIRNVRRADMGNAPDGSNDINQAQCEALQIKLLRAFGSCRALDQIDQIYNETNYQSDVDSTINLINAYLSSGKPLDTPTAVPTTEGIKMIDIKQQTLVNGQNVTSLSDDQIFTIISQAEADMKTLNAIENKPAKLTAKIAALQASIEALGAIVDARP